MAYKAFDPLESRPFDSHRLAERYSGGLCGIRGVGATAPSRVFRQTPVGLVELNPAEINRIGHQRMLDNLNRPPAPFHPTLNPFGKIG